MKVQDLLSAYLLTNKRLSLPGVGIFEIHTASVSSPSPENQMIAEEILFTPEKGMALEEDLLLFLKERTGKMKALAQSDLDSFINSGMQLLNIGKPFEIPGIGAVQKSSEGVYSFQQGLVHNEQLVTDQTRRLLHPGERGPEEEEHHDWSLQKEPVSWIKNKWFIGSIVLGVALVIWLLFLLLNSDKKSNPVVEDAKNAEPVTSPLPSDSASLSNNPTDSLQSAPAATDTIKGFELLIQSSPNADSTRMYYRKLKTRGHSVRLDSSAGPGLKVIYSSSRPLSDSTYVIDSLRKWYLIRARFHAKGINP